ncbi:pyridoxamine 5'-phosphate oxidase family protein [Streptomyces sp. TP-A0874]|uniref:pyridoxamine 5'-phosphate oxidase family protein n=1 Tax=Streptomyces sp. TP-A0874 TaxID=549819 RepID=UPI000853873F|nr:pyridoxamine 5'-phosphate oxidase family protein [Streptomyces sp. TP-A0874]
MSPDTQRAIDLFDGTAYGLLSASMRALPFIAAAQHIVTPDGVLLRLHRGHGYHQACDGNVVAYATHGPLPDTGELWSAQVVGTARVVERPGGQELDLLGAPPARIDEDPFDPVYLRIEPQIQIVHSIRP